MSSWESIDLAICAIGKRRSVLESEEAALLIDAIAAKVHVHCGYGSMREYLERRLGYTPRVAEERVRVATELQNLPQLRDALAAGRLHYSAVRELSRVATPKTEPAWIEATLNKTMREIEPMVAGRTRGDLPTDPPCPVAETRTLRFEVSPQTHAMLRDARRVLDDEAGERLSDDELIARLCEAALRPGASTGARPAYQIAITTCDTCERGWQDGGGNRIEVGSEVVEQARCDAVEIGRLDTAAPERVTTTIPEPVRRKVLRRFSHRCCVPGCRASRRLQIHHLTWRSRGGADTVDNLVPTCSAHHARIHDGTLRVSGTVDSLRFEHRDGRAYGAPPRKAPGATDGYDEVAGEAAVPHVGAPPPVPESDESLS